MAVDLKALDPAALALIAARFKVLGEPVRLAILQALHGGERTVSDLAAKVGTSQPNISRHLRLLEEAGMVARRQVGTTVHCRIADRTVLRLCALVCQGAWGHVESRAATLAASRPRGLPKRTSSGAAGRHRGRG